MAEVVEKKEVTANDILFNRIQLEVEELVGLKKISRAEADRRIRLARKVKAFLDGKEISCEKKQ